ncbi:hypothetical protein LTR70_009398 [Exophiala xenobiotica]|nr:hypothetical protein LTR70_009398 [Exophiala xenobiotica]
MPGTLKGLFESISYCLSIDWMNHALEGLGDNDQILEVLEERVEGRDESFVLEQSMPDLVSFRCGEAATDTAVVEERLQESTIGCAYGRTS